LKKGKDDETATRGNLGQEDFREIAALGENHFIPERGNDEKPRLETVLLSEGKRGSFADKGDQIPDKPPNASGFSRTVHAGPFSLLTR
jgi:hypothetical protein